MEDVDHPVTADLRFLLALLVAGNGRFDGVPDRPVRRGCAERPSGPPPARARLHPLCLGRPAARTKLSDTCCRTGDYIRSARDCPILQRCQWEAPAAGLALRPHRGWRRRHGDIHRHGHEAAHTQRLRRAA